MKRIPVRLMSLLLCLLMLLSLGACGKKEDPVQQGTDAPAANAPATPDKPAEQPDKQTPAGPQYGALRAPERGSFRSGRTIAFEDVTYAAFTDGIYRLHSEGGELVAPASLSYFSSFCTDGYTLYYIDMDSVLYQCELDKNEKITPVFSTLLDEAAVCSSVVGVASDRFYLQSDSWEGEFSNVVVVSAKNGSVMQVYEGFHGGCDGGLTYIHHDSYDVSPLPMTIFDKDGEPVVETEYAWTPTASDGGIWYSLWSEDANDGKQELHRVTAESDEVVLTGTETGGDFFGWSIGGFLASLIYYQNDYSAPSYYDLRDGRRLESNEVDLEGNTGWWSDGVTVDGVDYLVSYSRAARMTEAGPVPVVELPEGINNQGMTLVSGEVMVPCSGGVFYRLPLDPDGWQHVVPATMGYMQREDYDGKTGETIYVKYPVMMVDGPYYYEGLYHAMTEYNDQVLDQAEALSAECMNKVSEQIDNGFTDPEDFYTATVDVYIQRSDVTAFSFLEHQWINTTLSRTDVDLWTGYNFNTKDGSMLSLKDVVTDIGKLKDVMVSLTDSTHRAFFDEILTGDLVSRPACSWVLGYEGLTFWFNPQVNYTYGGVPVSVFIPFADYPELFTDSVTCVPRDYAYDVVVEDYWSHPLTLSCDEGSLSVRPSARKNSDIGVYDKLSLDCGSNAFSDDLFSDCPFASIIHIGSEAPVYGKVQQNGLNYLALQTTGDGMELYIYKLDPEGVEVSYRSYGTNALTHLMPLDLDFEDMPYIYHNWFGNPNFFTMVEDQSGGGDYFELHTIACTIDAGAPIYMDISGGSQGVG